MTFHLSEDVVRAMEPGGFKNIFGILILVTWLYGTLMLRRRLAGRIIMLLGGLLGSAVPVLHMTGAGLVGGKIEGSSGVFFWVWTLIALGVTSLLTLILSAQALFERKQDSNS